MNDGFYGTVYLYKKDTYGPNGPAFSVRCHFTLAKTDRSGGDVTRSWRLKGDDPEKPSAYFACRVAAICSILAGDFAMENQHS